MALLLAIIGALRSAFRSRASLVAENLALRQQLAVLRVGRRPRLRPIDRAFWIVLSRVWLRQADERGDVFPLGRPDLADLDRFMWDTDSPFERRQTADGGVEIVARGRSALTLAVWLQQLIERGR